MTANGKIEKGDLVGEYNPPNLIVFNNRLSKATDQIKIVQWFYWMKWCVMVTILFLNGEITDQNAPIASQSQVRALAFLVHEQ